MHRKEVFTAKVLQLSYILALLIFTTAFGVQKKTERILYHSNKESGKYYNSHTSVAFLTFQM